MRERTCGDRVGEYRLERFLGRGGAGLVFVAVHVRLGHRVVIKLLRPDRATGEQRARFLREGRALTRIEHPGIVKLLHAGQEDDGTEYLVLDHLEGTSLRELLSSRAAPLPLHEVAGILAQVAGALRCAHRQGVIHRDIKPENLIIQRRPHDRLALGGLRVHLIDFGLARLQQGDETVEEPPWPEGLTQLETPVAARPGTPPYRAPELGLELEDPGGARADSAALDAYSLGVLGWELMAGVRPRAADLAGGESALIARRPECAGPLSALIAGLIAPAPQDRPDLIAVVGCTTPLAAQGPQGGTGLLARLVRSVKKSAHFLPGSRLSTKMFALIITLAASLLFLSGRWNALLARLPFARPAAEAQVIVVTQPVFGAIPAEDIASALPPGRAIVRRVDVAPLIQQGPRLDSPDWPALQRRQRELVQTRLLPALQTQPAPQLAYFGLVPIPLAIDLGAQLGVSAGLSVYQRSHHSQSWRWPSAHKTIGVRTTGLPQDRTQEHGPVILRVATSIPIEPELTRELVSAPLAEIDVKVAAPGPDVLSAEQDLEEVTAAVHQALNAVADRIPHATAVHLFAAVPCGLALRIGTVISPTIHPPVQTYHYDRGQSPRYQPALLVNDSPSLKSTRKDAMATSTQPMIERRLEHFVDWLKPDPEAESLMAARADEIRQRIRQQAVNDKLTVRSTPGAGSFAKKTGLRRHVTGGSSVDGQDVDIPFVLSPLGESEERIGRLLDRFQGYADRAYPQRPPNKSRTKSSIKIEFVGTSLSFDLVPMIIAPEYGEDYQWLLRGDGTRRLTSVTRHNDFIRRRSNESNQLPGRVKFNECVRLLKWWREFRMENDRHSIPGMPSILLEMMAAYAFDQKKVQVTYAETLYTWFDFLHEVVSQRRRIGFADYPLPRGRRHAPKTPWMVIEPVDPENNLTHDWIDQHIDELAGWLKRGRDDMRMAIDLDRRNNPQESLHHLVRIFGTPFKHHCGDKP